MTVIHITASELQEGDTWLGENDVVLDVLDVDHASEVQMMVPWALGRNAIPVPMVPVRIRGVYMDPSTGMSYHGHWTLQPDQPLEVRRVRRGPT